MKKKRSSRCDSITFFLLFQIQNQTHMKQQFILLRNAIVIKTNDDFRYRQLPL